ncbi:hypothetical protein ACFCZ1_03520 [Streptomyces sp. NPDC056224]|uniref:hypothetical protein n=1 Tax=Streptomyces sp. NPDC056224 TaxID=3345750 RepID=UPI0035E334F2
MTDKYPNGADFTLTVSDDFRPVTYSVRRRRQGPGRPRELIAERRGRPGEDPRNLPVDSADGHGGRLADQERVVT